NAATRTQVLNCLLEGCSVRATVRMTGVSKKCVMRLLVEAGKVAEKFQDRVLRGLACRRIQVDELWGFCYCKQKNLTVEIAEKNPSAGDVCVLPKLKMESPPVKIATTERAHEQRAQASHP